MAKEINIESIVSDKQLDKILDFLMEVAKNANESSMNRDEKKKTFEEMHPKEYAKVQAEMKRVFDLIEKTNPTDHEYYNLVSHYKSLLGLIDGNIY